ncbi:MAG: hypothetical protein MUC50_02465 [Myxococcota bacterium]|nr:hypothetical protein [Myxococcota bacterium]
MGILAVALFLPNGQALAQSAPPPGSAPPQPAPAAAPAPSDSETQAPPAAPAPSNSETLPLPASPASNPEPAESQTDASPSAQSAEKVALPAIPPLHWMFLVTPIGGYLKNTTTFNAKVPSRSGEDVVRSITMSGKGWGTGLLLVGFYKWISATNVFYIFPNVNRSLMWGNIFMLQYTAPLDFFIAPTVGMGLAVIGTDSDLYNFRYAADDVYQETPTIGRAYFGHFMVNTLNLEPLPEIGAKIRIPIQDWYVRPFYQFLYENLSAHVRTPSFTVNVYQKEDGQHLFQINDEKGFEGEQVTEYYSNVVGMSYGIDYNHFLCLQGSVTYNITHNLLSTRATGSLMFSRFMGVSAYFEYQDMIMVDNIFGMLGLTFIGLPSDFWNAVDARRKAAMAKKKN